jgi:hypothetical protein
MTQPQPPLAHVGAATPPQPAPGLFSDRAIVGLLVIVGALLRVASYLYSDNAGGDAWARVALTAQWLRHPGFKVVFDAYPPGHFWLIALLHLLVPDITVASRLLSLILGIASLPIIFKLTMTVYGPQSALLALAVFSFYSLHIGYSSTSSSEVCYLFFLLVAFLYFFDGLKSGDPWKLAISGVALSAAELIRLEAWAIFFGMALLLLIDSYREAGVLDGMKAVLRPGLVFLACGAVAPAIMMISSWLAFRNPLQVLTLHDTLVTESLKARPVPLTHQLAVIPLTLLITLSPPAFLASIYGLVKSFPARVTSGFAALTVFFVLVQNLEILRGRLLAMPRYSLTAGAMLAVLSGYGLSRFCAALAPRKLRSAYVALIVLLLLNLGVILIASEVPSRWSEKVSTISPRLRYTQHIAEVASFLRANVGPNDSVVIDDYGVESNIVGAAAGLPLVADDRTYIAGRRNSLTVLQYISAEHPRWLVYADRGKLRSSLPLPPGCSGVQEMNGVRFRCAFAGSIYRVFELSYP